MAETWFELVQEREAEIEALRKELRGFNERQNEMRQQIERLRAALLLLWDQRAIGAEVTPEVVDCVRDARAAGEACSLYDGKTDLELMS